MPNGTLAPIDPPVQFVGDAPVRVALAWTADGGGNLDQTTPFGVVGLIVGVGFAPGTGGDAPTDGHNLTLEDLIGADVLHGAGEGLSNAEATRVCPVDANGIPPTVAEPLRLRGNTLGAGKRGTLILYLRPA